MLLRRQARRGSALVESALVYPVLFLLVMGAILLGVGVFRFQQMSHISREASRWASVHGEAYLLDPISSEPVADRPPKSTAEGVYNHAVVPHAAGLRTDGMTYAFTRDNAAGTITYTGTNSGGITYSITWNMQPNGEPDKGQTRTVVVYDPATGLYESVARSNTVSVTVTYTWNTGLFGTIPVSSTSTNTISY